MSPAGGRQPSCSQKTRRGGSRRISPSCRGLGNARPIAHVLVITKNTNQSVCYNAVTALTKCFCQNAVGPARPPRPFAHPTTPSIGCAHGGSATGALGLPPLYLGATLRSKDRFCHA